MGKLVFMIMTSFFPLAFLILAVLGSILFGLATPTEAASIGAIGGMVLAVAYRAMTWQRMRESVYLTVRTTAMVCWLFVGSYTFSSVFSYLGGEQIISTFVQSLDLTPLQFLLMAQFIIFLLGWPLEWSESIISCVPFFLPLLALCYRALTWQRLRESVYLTVRTAAMVCWLFVGSWTFSSVFSYLGGEQLISEFVIGLELSPVMFLILAQLIIFLLGWPLEWSEIIIIFVPIFLPLLPHFDIDPLFFGILVALNLQTSFLTPPMAMAAYYLKGIAPPHVQLTQIFKGVMPFLFMVLVAMILLYVFPGLALWLPKALYG
jgi:TRAP-type mannitol/chloroaromatic compound transport system permease large subunit